MTDKEQPRDDGLKIIGFAAFFGGLIGGGNGMPVQGAVFLAAGVAAAAFAFFRKAKLEEVWLMILVTFMVITVPVGAIGFYIGRYL